MRKKLSKIPFVSLVAISIGFCEFAFAQDIISCMGSAGKVVFTDSTKNCDSKHVSNGNEIEKIKIQNTNVHSQYGESVSEEYHNYSFRIYEEIRGYSIRVIAEKKLIDESPKILETAAKKLEMSVGKAIFSFPEHVRHEFDDVKFYLFNGEESRTRSRKGGQWYFRKGNITSARFDDSIVIRSVKDYINLYSNERAALTAAHELSHAYYYYHRNRIYGAINKAFKNAENKGLYTNVKLKSGSILKKGYAVTNQREYFAELSKTFNIGNYYSPFNASELEVYDPVGYRVIKETYFYKL